MDIDGDFLLAVGCIRNHGHILQSVQVEVFEHGAGADVEVDVIRRRAGKISRRELDDLRRFLKNPAEYYYRNVLKVCFNDLSDVALEDQEVLSPETLGKHNILDTILTAQLGGRGLASVRPELGARGLAPLAAPGDVYVRDCWTKTESFLSARMDGPLPNTDIRALCARLREAKPLRVEVEIGGRLVCGSLGVTVLEGRPVWARCRLWPIKTRDLVSAWPAHLLLCAAGHPTHTLVVGGETTPDIRYFEPIANREEALRELGKLNDLFRQGHSDVLPFAPETSFDYASQVSELGRQQPPPDGEAIQAAALSAAVRRWTGSKYVRGETADPYLFRAFGDQGPTALSGFGDTAMAVYGPMLAALKEC